MPPVVPPVRRSPARRALLLATALALPAGATFAAEPLPPSREEGAAIERARAAPRHGVLAAGGALHTAGDALAYFTIAYDRAWGRDRITAGVDVTTGPRPGGGPAVAYQYDAIVAPRFSLYVGPRLALFFVPDLIGGARLGYLAAASVRLTPELRVGTFRLGLPLGLGMLTTSLPDPNFKRPDAPLVRFTVPAAEVGAQFGMRF